MTLTWGELLDRAAADPRHCSAIEALIASARDVASEPVVRRVYKYEDVGKHRTWLDGRAVPLEPEIQETFALAMSDCGTAGIVARELPLLAAAYRMTGDKDLLVRVLQQLDEMTLWSPIQRPGWTCYHRGGRLPDDGKDGNWLATGTGVRAIGDALEILPVGAVDATICEKLDTLLRAEVAGVVDDWEKKRPWFVRSDNPVTNQWVLPTEGLVRACLMLGTKRFPDAYELGVKNLLRALSAHGSAGEFEEGIGYASFTVASMLHAARAMAAAGDRRALDHPFLKHFADWVIQHLQPGRSGINCFDAGASSRIPRDSAGFRQLLSLLAAFTGSESARWALTEQFDGPSDDMAGLLARALPDAAPPATPPTYAAFERATRVNWRSSWDDDATGVWVRGGHETDQHDHADRGHVNLIVGGKPILIEAGTPAYSHPEISRLFGSGVGHNVLQIGTVMPNTPPRGTSIDPQPGWQLRRCVAPLTVHALNVAGGSVSVDGTKCYKYLECWQRTVGWSVSHLHVDDRVVMADGQKSVVFFRWHLGTEEVVTIEGNNADVTVTWSDAQIALDASAPIVVEQTTLPDCTVQGRPADGAASAVHTCLVVRSQNEVHDIRITTHVTPDR